MYNGLDYLQFRRLLSEEENVIMKSVRKWVEKRVIPDIGDYFQRAEFPSHLVKEMAELGLLGMTIPEKYGGAGSSYTEYVSLQVNLDNS
jgi:glutaryl-CoA dehydrogenase